MEGRFDTYFYKSEFLEIEKRIKSLEHLPLSKLVRFSNETWNQQDYFADKFPYIEISKINTLTGELTEIQNIPIKEAPSRAKMVVRNNYIIVSTTRPNRGAISKIITEENLLIASTGFSIICKAKDNINIDYLFHLLRTSFSLKQMERRATGGNYPAITQSELKKIIFPIKLDTHFQENIVNIVSAAEETRLSKLKEANNLLRNIDSFLLSELGIILPEEKSNSIGNRIFMVSFFELSNNRIDPYKYSCKPKALLKSILSSKQPILPLKKLIISKVAGDWGLDEKEAIGNSEYIECLVIRSTEIDNKYNLNLQNDRAKYRFISREKISKLDIKENDILIEKSGGSPDQPVGRVALIDKSILSKGNICFSNFIQKIRVNTDEIIPEYLFYYLSTIYNIKLTDFMQSQTSGIRNLIMSEYYNIPIVKPTKIIQRKIVNKINSMKTSAQNYELEAEQVLYKAKEEIEKIILGEI